MQASYVIFQCIPGMTLDVLSMDYCTFGLMKRTLSKRKPTTIDGPWKVVEINTSENFVKSTSIMNITIQTCNPEIRLSE